MHRRLRLAVLLATAVACTPPATAAAQDDDLPTDPEVARITRDVLGVPHIAARTEKALAFGTGYAVAVDRPFLLAAIRLTAQGRTTELLGESALPADVAIRRDFYDAADVARQTAELPADLRAQLEAFAAGVNRGMGEVLADPLRRPAAFDLLGYTPEPWTAADSVAVTMLFTYAIFAGEGGAGQLRNAAMLADLQERFGGRRGRAMWDDLVFRNDPRAPAIVSKREGPRAPRGVARERPGRAQLALARELARPLRAAARARMRDGQVLDAVLKRLPIPKIGSYGFALTGAHTKSGGGLLLGAPQAGLASPPVFYQLGQRMPGRDCAGFTVPGLGPFTGVGWCNDHTWTLVAGNAGEQVDHYVSRLVPGEPRRYRFGGATREVTVRREVFRVNRCLPPVCTTPTPARTHVEEVEETVHGAVVHRDDEAGILISQRRAQKGVWAQSLRTVEGWNEARDLREFRAATDLANGTYNLLYADAAGHAMYRFTGLQPIRRSGIDRRLPSPGDGSAEWTGMIPDRRMPQVVDPRSGVLAVNQGIEAKPAAWWPNASGVTIGRAQRPGRNRGLLVAEARARGGLDVPATEALHGQLLEHRDWITSIVAPHLERALSRSADPRLRRALELLRAWQAEGYARLDRDGDGRYDQPAFTLFGADNFNLDQDEYPRHVWTGLLQRIFGDELRELPGSRAPDGTFQIPGGWLGNLSRLERALADGHRSRAKRRLSRDWADDVRTPQRERLDDHVRAAVLEAMDRLQQEFGTADPARWLRPVPELPFAANGVVAPPPLRVFDHGTYVQAVDPRAGAGRWILPPGNQAADSAGAIAGAQLGRFPAHVVDQRLPYERYELLEMRRAPERYRDGAEEIVEVRADG